MHALTETDLSGESQTVTYAIVNLCGLEVMLHQDIWLEHHNCSPWKCSLTKKGMGNLCAKVVPDHSKFMYICKIDIRGIVCVSMSRERHDYQAWVSCIMKRDKQLQMFKQTIKWSKLGKTVTSSSNRILLIWLFYCNI